MKVKIYDINENVLGTIEMAKKELNSLKRGKSGAAIPVSSLELTDLKDLGVNVSPETLIFLEEARKF